MSQVQLGDPQIDIAIEAMPATEWTAMQAVGRYTLLTLLGRGGMGEVWLGKLQGPKQFVKLFAIKRVIAELAEDLQSNQMLLDEARICARLQHPNIVPLFELNEEAGVVYFVMEYAPGENLGRLMKLLEAEKLSLSTTQRVSIVCDVASALAYAHKLRDENGLELKLVHRDVSPSNVIITDDGQVKLLDFGVALAEARETVTEAGRVKGKFHYMAWEQMQGLPIDGRADQFSLGVLFAELLAGKRTAERSMLEGTPARFVTDLVAGLPESTPNELKTIVARMLSIDAAGRFPTMEQVEEALRQWLAAQPPGGSLVSTLNNAVGPQIEKRRAMLRLATSVTHPSFPIREPRATDQIDLNTPPTKSGVSPVSSVEPKRSDPRLLIGVGALVGMLVVGGIFAAVARSGSYGPTGQVGGPRAVRPQSPPPETAVTPGSGAFVAKDTPAPGNSEAPREESPSPKPESVRPQKNPSAPPAPPPAPRLGSGRLSMQTVPWTVVYWGSKKLGETPLVEVPLPVGTHRLRLVNDEQSISTLVEVVIEPKKLTTVKFKL